MTTNWQDPGGPPPAPAEPNPNKRKRFAIVATLLVVIAGLGTAAGLVMVNRDSDDNGESAQYVVVDVADTTPVFEPRDARGNDPFYPLEVQLTAFREEIETEFDEQFAQAQANAEPGQGVARQEFDVAALDEAVKTGLYGGTEENTCDPERLISFLYANPDLGEAWAKVQGIEFAQIAGYIRSLEVRVLAEPVNVLNHGFDSASGAAYEIDTVLDAGTAVLVDSNGDIRTRCYCGNPIKPKPPQHMPPRCLVYGAFVFTEPAGTTKREGAARDVLLTGRQATVTGGGTWVEVKWGTSEDQSGWVQSQNLRKSYCPTPTSDRYCPGPGQTKVWHTPDTTTPVGRVTGEVRTVATTLDVFAPISPVGGLGGETIINDFMLIRFTEALSAQNSAWVKISDLNQDTSECERVRQCIDTEGPVWDRAGGAPIVGADGIIWAEFTGHFAADPATHTEIRLSDGSGTYGWIGLAYTPLSDERCAPPVLECVENAVVYETSTQTAPDHLGYLSNTTVEVIGGPQDGRLQIRFHNGPEGWVDQADFYDGYDRCEPYDVCVTSLAPGYTIFPDQGTVLDPSIGSPRFVQVIGQVIDDAPNTWTLIGIDGTNYWIDMFQIHLADCTPPQVDCPSSPYTSLLDMFTPRLRDPGTLDLATEMTSQMMVAEERGRPSSECCVSQLYDSPSPLDPSATPTPAAVFVIDSTEVGGTTWFRTTTGEYFQAVNILPPARCEVSECPDPFSGTRIDEERIREIGDLLIEEIRIDRSDGGSGTLRLAEEITPDRTERPSSGECCVSHVFSDFQGVPLPPPGTARWVDVASGPHDADPAWYRTTDGSWFPETAVVEGTFCTPVNCPTDTPDRGVLDRERLLLAEELDTLLVVTEATRVFLPGDTATCCVSGSLFDGPGGDVSLTPELPIPVTVVEVSDDGDWYKVWVEPDGIHWAHMDQFVDLDRCLPDDGGHCPEVSIITVIDVAQSLCCIAFQTNGAPVFDQVIFTGETRPSGDGGTEYLALDGEWVPEEDFVNSVSCTQTPECPLRTSIIDPQDRLTCCVTLGNGTFEEVTLTGTVRELAGGVIEYEATNGEWYLASEFATAGRCGQDSTPCNGQVVGNECCERPNEVFQNQCVPPCPTGQTRNANGVCEAPSQPATPTPTPTSPPSCENSDQDTHCNVDDNCDSVTNEDQADADEDGLGDACDPCTDADLDLFCEKPGDINNDNCWGIFNPDQGDADRDGVGDVCDNCPTVSNPQQENADGDALGDACECPPVTGSTGNGDSDGDGICDVDDNCVRTVNPGQVDSDGDFAGDACDNCPNLATTNQSDIDGDGRGDDCDICPGVNGPVDTRRTPNPLPGYLYDTDDDGINDSCFPRLG